MSASRNELQPGDIVTVATLGRSGSVLERLSSGAYKISIGSLTITAKINELTLTQGHPLNQKQSNESMVSIPKRNTAQRRTFKASIDLHGLTVDQASRALEDWINQMIIADVKQGKVIHGLGSGKVQKASHETLSRYSAVRAFRINDVNPGETDVYFG